MVVTKCSRSVSQNFKEYFQRGRHGWGGSEQAGDVQDSVDEFERAVLIYSFLKWRQLVGETQALRDGMGGYEVIASDTFIICDEIFLSNESRVGKQTFWTAKEM